jgi:hypothetical protein
MTTFLPLSGKHHTCFKADKSAKIMWLFHLIHGLHPWLFSTLEIFLRTEYFTPYEDKHDQYKISNKYYFYPSNLNFTGKVYMTRTAFPLWKPGIHFSAMWFMESTISAAAIPQPYPISRTTLISVIEPSFSTTN